MMAENGSMLLVHAESSRVLDELINRFHTPSMMERYGARLHAMTRPNFVEAEAIQRAVTWCEVTGGPLYIVHMSTGEGAEIIKAAQARGVPVIAETCAQYLVLDDSVFAGPDGHLFACCPQLKKPKDIPLWEGLRNGRYRSCRPIPVHSPASRRPCGTETGPDSHGLPGLETLLPVVYTHGVLENRLTIKQLVDKLSHNPARIMGLAPRKGTFRWVRMLIWQSFILPADSRSTGDHGDQRRLEPLRGARVGRFCPHYDFPR